MLIVKIMSGDGQPDEFAAAQHRILAGVIACDFTRNPDGCHATVTFDDHEIERFAVRGNVYVMNSAGKTISSFAPEGFVLSGSDEGNAHNPKDDPVSRG